MPKKKYESEEEELEESEEEELEESEEEELEESEEEDTSPKNGDIHNLTDADCGICMEPFHKTKKGKKRIECACGASACEECQKTGILLGSTPAKCFGCGMTWTNKFLIESFGAGWINSNAQKGYRYHLKKVYFEAQKARIPEMVTIYGDISAFGEDRKRQKEIIEEKQILTKKFEKIGQKLRSIDSELHRIELREYDYNRGVKPVSYSLPDVLTHFEPPEKEEPHIKVVSRCPYSLSDSNESQCRGLITSKGICIIDPSHTICKKCHAILDQNKKKKHKCDPKEVKSVKAKLADSMACPTCAALVNKIDGCNSMWCVICHTSFDYLTGKVAKTTHNPHLIEWQMRNQKSSDREYVGGNCEVPPEPHDFLRFIPLVHSRYNKLIIDIFRVYLEILEDLDLAEEEEGVGVRKQMKKPKSDNFLLLLYLSGEYDEKQFKDALFRTKREKGREEARLQIYDTARILLGENLRSLYDRLSKSEPYKYKLARQNGQNPIPGEAMISRMKKHFDDFSRECDSIRKFINETFVSEMKPLGSTSFPKINADWRRIHSTETHE